MEIKIKDFPLYISELKDGVNPLGNVQIQYTRGLSCDVPIVSA